MAVKVAINGFGRIGRLVYRALVEDVIVHPDHQGQGVGQMLLDAVVAHSGVRDLEVVFLFTSKPGFYERFGFKTTDQGMYRYGA